MPWLLPLKTGVASPSLAVPSACSRSANRCLVARVSASVSLRSQYWSRLALYVSTLGRWCRNLSLRGEQRSVPSPLVTSLCAEFGLGLVTAAHAGVKCLAPIACANFMFPLSWLREGRPVGVRYLSRLIHLFSGVLFSCTAANSSFLPPISVLLFLP
jgi:hypothetical protein